MEKELDQQIKVEYDNYGNVIINGKRYLSEESHNHFTQSLQTQNNDLLSKFNELENKFSAFKQEATQKERNDILLKAGVMENQLGNVSKLMSDIPTEELVKTLDNDRNFDIFRKSQLRTQEQQPKNEEVEQSKESENFLKDVYKAFM